MKAPVLAPPYPPSAMILFCPLCGAEVHRTLRDDMRFPEVIAHEADLFCALHMLRHHRFRFWLWGRLRWHWLVRGMA